MAVSARWAIDRKNAVLEGWQRALRHENTHHQRVQLDPVYDDFSIRFIKVGLIVGFTICVDMDALFFAAVACPEEGWIGTPDLNPAWKIGLCYVELFLG